MEDMLVNLFANRHRKFLLDNELISDALRDYLCEPLIQTNTLIKDIEFLVLDFETTGLDANKDRIVSIGWTIIKELSLLNNSSEHFLVNPDQLLHEDNVNIHQLTDDEVSQGLPFKNAMDKLFQVMKNKVIIVHFDSIEKKFINNACKNLFQFESLPMRMLDTLKIEKKKNNYNRLGSLRLYALREKYNLPRYKAHNAMIDAISTAELFLAQMSYKDDLKNIKLSHLL